MNSLELDVPTSYKEATQDERDSVCNGCGLEGWKGNLVPDSILGVDITEACYIHDWDYRHGTTLFGKHKADLRFLNNMIILINRRGGCLTWLRRWQAMGYYNAVRDFGTEAYWEGKE